MRGNLWLHRQEASGYPALWATGHKRGAAKGPSPFAVPLPETPSFDFLAAQTQTWSGSTQASGAFGL